MAQRTLFTVGHSTHSWAEFVALLKAWKIKNLIDVRTLPRSRAFPWFTKQRMARAMPKAGIEYVHVPALGGLRTPKKESVNTGWQNARFRAYADFMQTEEFEHGLRELNGLREKWRVCVMCSEALWWRCHRRIIADAEVARGIPVKHIISETLARRHELTAFAVVKKNRRRAGGLMITYPGSSRTAMAAMLVRSGSKGPARRAGRSAHPHARSCGTCSSPTRPSRKD